MTENKVKIFIFGLLLISLIGFSGCVGNIPNGNVSRNQTYKVQVVNNTGGSSFWMYYILFMNPSTGQYQYAMQDPKSSTGWSALTDKEVSAIQQSKGQITEEEYSEFIEPQEPVSVPSEIIDEPNAEISSGSDGSSNSGDSGDSGGGDGGGGGGGED